jgi:hypothetical protein
MANIYVRSTDGSDADNGSTWALAKATIAGACAIDAAGDTIYVSQAHNETTAAGISWVVWGTLPNPTRIICVDDSAEPPTTLATTGVVNMTNATTATLAITGDAGVPGGLYVYGLTFNLGTTARSSMSWTVGPDGRGRATFEKCNFHIATNIGFGSSISPGGAGHNVMLDCGFKFAHASYSVPVASNRMVIIGGSILSGGVSPTTLFASGTNFSGDTLMEGFDLSNCDSALQLQTGSAGVTRGRFVMRNCKMPASWTGAYFSASARTEQWLASFHNDDSTGTNYRSCTAMYAGDILSETTLVRSGGATDGITPLAWKATTNANANFLSALVTEEMTAWVDQIGAARTATVEILHDSATNLKDDEVWLEVKYLGSSATPICSHLTDFKASVIATAADQATSSATWNTTGMSNPNKQKLEVTFTPQMKGFVHAKVYISKASKTVYIDPMLTVT